jgi:hypothetical protein
MTNGSTAMYDDLAIEPDVEFDRALRRRLDHDLRSVPVQPFTLPADIEVDVPLWADPEPATREERGRSRRSLLAVAAAITASIAVGVVVDQLVVDDSSNPPAATLPASTSPPATIATPSTVLAPATTEPLFSHDDIVAIKSMLWDTDVGISGYSHQVASAQPATLDGAIAVTLPACQRFASTVFESEARPAVTSDRQFTNADNHLLVLQYVTVLPSLDEAVAMFDGMQDPGFIGSCVPAYRASVQTMCCDVGFKWTPVFNGEELEPPTINVVADDVWVRQWIGSWNGVQGLDISGPQQMVSVGVRVGRVVSLIDVSLTTDGVPDDATIQDVERIAQRMATRAADAQLVN